MLNITIRATTFVLFLVWFIYWSIGERQADRAKPRQQKFRSLLEWVSGQFGRTCLGIIFVVQILGWQIFTFKTDFRIETLGFGIFLLGFFVCIAARKTLGINWTNGLNYQIKKDHELVTVGVYKYVRHPIYIGGSLLVLGIELIVGSYLFLAFFVMLLISFLQGKREEKILLSHFGEKYKIYMRSTKMLIPFVL